MYSHFCWLGPYIVESEHDFVLLTRRNIGLRVMTYFIILSQNLLGNIEENLRVTGFLAQYQTQDLPHIYECQLRNVYIKCGKNQPQSRWQGPAAHTKDRPVLSSERASHGMKNVAVRRIPYSERKKKSGRKPRMGALYQDRLAD
jgi:hypothetical protein